MPKFYPSYDSLWLMHCNACSEKFEVPMLEDRGTGLWEPATPSYDPNTCPHCKSTNVEIN